MANNLTRQIAALALTIGMALSPLVAYAAMPESETITAGTVASLSGVSAGTAADSDDGSSTTIKQVLADQAAAEQKAAEDAAKVAEKADKQLQAEKMGRSKTQAQINARLDERYNKTLSYSKKLLRKIGTQEQTGHTICCPSFSCAYGDAVLDGTYHDHDYYTCSSCTWPNWGGAASVDRCAGSSAELLREAYDQVSQGRPTVIHVNGVVGEHWVCLIGFQDAKDPDHLTLDNFIALDPWDGAEITVTDRYTLYGDGCEHLSSR